MIDVSSLNLLKGKKALVTGVANDQSIAWGCAKAFRAFGADVAMTYLNDKAKPHVEPLAKEIDASLLMPLDLQREGELRSGIRANTKEVGHSRYLSPLDRVCAKGRSAGTQSLIAPRTDFSKPWKFRAGRS